MKRINQRKFFQSPAVLVILLLLSSLISISHGTTNINECLDGVCLKNEDHNVGDAVTINGNDEDDLDSDDYDASDENYDDVEEEEEDCIDSNKQCSFWAKEGECDANPNYMLQYCRLSCNVCDNDPDSESWETVECVDDDENCSDWAIDGRCEKNPRAMATACKKSCGVCSEKFDTGALQIIPPTDTNSARSILNVIHDSHTYYHTHIAQNDTLANIRSGCLNQHVQCAEWAHMGECDVNPKYMKMKCALACRSCDMLELSIRCPLDPEEPEALNDVGDLDRLFEEILGNGAFAKYRPSVLSRPYHPPEEEQRESDNYIIGPWVLAFDDFLTAEECNHLIQQGYDKGYERSTGVGELQIDGTNKAVKSTSRTSTNAWCTDECYNTTTTKTILNRIETITGIPETNGEYLQLLRYEAGQFYSSHHDYLENDLKYPWGPRILTFYLYLNDVVRGGGTRFTDLDLMVTPKRGSAILWPSVLNEAPKEIDSRTNHEAIAVEEGIKYGANAWIHLRNFKKHYDGGCS